MKHAADWVPIPKRALIKQERAWVDDILSVNPEWSDVSHDELYAVAKCPCGLCKTVLLEAPPEPQNPRTISKRGLLGEIDIQIESGELITVMLFADGGSLTELEIVCEHSFKAVPDTWKEVARWINVG